MPQRFSLERSLEGHGRDLDSILAAMLTGGRCDLAGLPHGAAALLLARRIAAGGEPLLVLTPDAESAARLEGDLRFFTQDGGDDATSLEGARAVLRYPAADTSPFVEVAPDRRAAMDRLSALFHLAQGLPWSCVIAPIRATLRRVPPREAIRRCSALVEVDAELERDALIQLLADGGYLRVPVVEDPGSFAVRGNLIDVFPPHARMPARIELDFDAVLSIRAFDPDDQRGGQDLKRIAIHPVRETLLTPQDLAHASEQVGELCDAHNYPTSRRRQLVEDIASGRAFLGIENFLPAFYPQLEDLFDYLPAGGPVVVFDPARCGQIVEEELDRADRDRAARIEDGAPTYGIGDHYVSAADLLKRIEQRPHTVVHPLAISGEQSEDEQHLALSELSRLDTDDQALQVGAQDQSGLTSALKTRRTERDGTQPLRPLVELAEAWLEEGMRVWLTTRTQTQAQRLAGLLSGYGLSVAPPAAYTPALLEQPADGRLRVVVGPLEDGFVLPVEALACVTDGEIFGQRRKQGRSRATRDRKHAFIEDLGQLAVGDYVVHAEHGIGRYHGLSHQSVPVSRYEQQQGLKPRRVEVLIVEYLAGDKLYLPVTRLNQVEKYAGSDAKGPRLDKLGGQTFAKTKSRVRTAVRQMADELLALYAQRAARNRPAYPAPDRLYAEFEAAFPYDETPDQARAVSEVLADMQGERPMDRLVCGDVGFGKTEVALRAAFRVAVTGRQVALLCPTTVLAQQHARTFMARLRDYPLRLEVLSRFVPKKQQTATVAALKEGKVDIVVGTHRVLSKDVHFRDLGLLIVDEEQRFGVGHKERIKKLKTDVDVLTLSATPIPRTLQLAIGGLRELSLITTPPLDRRAIRTFVTRWDDHVIKEAIQRELSRGGQVFFVHNRIDQLYERASRLQELVPDARIATTHGRLKASTLETLMTDFVEGRYDVLCSTAIVENGLDIPRANTILIDRADMFGLSQLYQLRGRVGRSRERAYCYLIAPPPNVMKDEARTRIEALERFSQLGAGFQIASLDMEMRGAGDLLGAEQSGTVGAVGFDMFVHMLQEAVAELRGETVVHEVDPEMTLSVEHYLPDDYVEDVGLRLSLYKRFASAQTEADIDALGEEMEDRFGPPPAPALLFARVMALKPRLRRLRVLGCEASSARVTLHFREDAPLDPAGLVRLVSASKRYSLSTEMKLTQRADEGDDPDPIGQVQELLDTLQPLQTEESA